VKEKYIKEMEKMSTTRTRSQKEAQLQGAISALSPQALTEVSQGSLTTALNNYAISIGNGGTGATWSAVSATAANTIRKDVNRWPEVQTNMIEIKEHEAFNAPVATLLNLWLTRFGNEWIDLEDIESDEFFAIAYKRLKQMGELEQHYLTDRARYVCRKPE
jgi:hypothetical protein